MKAAVLTEQGVQVRDVPTPKPGAAQVLVKVQASGLNRADLIMASGHPHGNAGGPGTVMGLEWSGEIVELIVMAGFYIMLARLTETTGVENEPSIADKMLSDINAWKNRKKG